jgi:nitroreductase
MWTMTTCKRLLLRTIVDCGCIVKYWRDNQLMNPFVFSFGYLLWCLPVCSYLALLRPGRQRLYTRQRNLFSSGADASSMSGDGGPLVTALLSVDEAALARSACKKFKRHDGVEQGSGEAATASDADPNIVQQALNCLDIARQAPSAFNAQPYKVILVHSAAQKLALSRYCLGPNAARVRDSDCTAIFLADRQVLRTLPRFTKWLNRQREQRKATDTDKDDNITRRRNRLRMLITQFYIAIFSSGYPLPRFLSAPLSFLVRCGVSVFGLFTQRFYPLPSLSNAETWSIKQVMLVAMTYMLACSSRGLATIPMEGVYAPGVRNVLKVPSRYSIPLIVSTGISAEKETGLQKGRTRRFPSNEVIYEDSFGGELRLLAPHE